MSRSKLVDKVQPGYTQRSFEAQIRGVDVLAANQICICRKR
jgi:hypothetical protein